MAGDAMSAAFQWGIIGAGRIARKFAAALRNSEEAMLSAVASRDADRARVAAAELGAASAYASYDELLADPAIDAVYLALPNSLHREWAKRAAQAGKHVLCEKPLALTAADAEDMFATARATGAWLMEAFMYRFHPRTLRLRQLLADGAIGTVRLVRLGFSFTLDRPADPRWQPELGGGALYDVGSYCVNLARSVVNEPPARAWATARWTPSGVDETLAGTLEYPGGAIAQIACSFRGGFQQQAQIVGSDGLIEIDQAYTMHPDQATRIRLWRGTQMARMEEISFEPTNHYQLELEGFGRLVRAGHRSHNLPEMPPAETIENLATIEALLRSARAGHSVDIT
jgi:predicted dehydrogenase